MWISKGSCAKALDKQESQITTKVFAILEVEANRSGDSARRYVVGSTEGRKEIVQCFLVGYIYDRQAQAHFVFVAMKNVVVADRSIEKIARCDAWRIVIVIFRTCRRNLDKVGPILRGGAKAARANRTRGSGVDTAAEKSGLELLIRCQT